MERARLRGHAASGRAAVAVFALTVQLSCRRSIDEGCRPMSDVLPSATAPTVAPDAAATVSDPPPEAQLGLGATMAKNSFWLLVDSIVGIAASFLCSVV